MTAWPSDNGELWRRLRLGTVAGALLTAAAVAGCGGNTAPGADPGSGTTDTMSGPTGLPSETPGTDSDSDQSSGSGSSSTP